MVDNSDFDDDEEKLMKQYKIMYDYMEKKSALISKYRKQDYDYADKLMKQRRMYEVATRASQTFGGGVGGSIFGFMQQQASLKMLDYTKLKDLKSAESERILTPDEARERDTLQSRSGMGMFGKLDKTLNKAFGDGSKWDKMFGGHGKAAAMGLGMGALGGGMALGKMIIDSSPMFQQMLKLLNFGIMMVLRPIGDFFGFFMRPILMALLQKLIIPFYQTYLPIAQKFGDDLGNSVVQFLEWIWGGIESMTKWAANEKTGDEVRGVINVLDGVISDDLDSIKTAAENANKSQEEIASSLKSQAAKILEETKPKGGGLGMFGSIGDWQTAVERSDWQTVFGKQKKLEPNEMMGFDVFDKMGKAIMRNLPLSKEAQSYYQDNLGMTVKRSVGTQNKSLQEKYDKLGLQDALGSEYGSPSGLIFAIADFIDLISKKSEQNSLREGVDSKLTSRYEDFDYSQRERQSQIIINVDGDVYDADKFEQKVSRAVEKFQSRYNR